MLDTEYPLVLYAFVAGVVFFCIAHQVLKYVLPRFNFFRKLSEHKRGEFHNRCLSLILDASCGTPATLAYYGSSLILPLSVVLVQRTRPMDLAAGWITGYDLYDGLVAIPVYGKSATVIILHHTLQVFVFYSYMSEPVGVYFMLGGGIMLVSSGVLHIQRLMSMYGVDVKSVMFKTVNLIMVASWFHTRFTTYFYLAYLAYITHSVTVIHAFNLWVAAAFTIMNVLWLKKMLLMKDLNF